MDFLICERAKVSGQVKSHARHRPFLKGKYEIPSGLFLSWIEVPFGSNLDVISADPRACFISSCVLETVVASSKLDEVYYL